MVITTYRVSDREPMIRILGLAASALGLLAVGVATPANADDDPASDAEFGRLLDRVGVLFNFNLEKRQGQRFCESIIAGNDPRDATRDLMQSGGYPFDVANGITSSAAVAYCTCTFSARQGLNTPLYCSPFELSYGRRP